VIDDANGEGGSLLNCSMGEAKEAWLHSVSAWRLLDPTASFGG
jgi:hypothetical protein